MRKWLAVIPVLLLMAALLLPGTALAVSPPDDVAGSPSGSGVTPVLVAGNPKGEDQGCGSNWFKPLNPDGTDATGSGIYIDADGTFPITVNITSDGYFFDWTANELVCTVIVKGGNNANIYHYGPNLTSDTQLHAPFKADGTPRAISHIEFVYDDTTPPVPELPTTALLGLGLAAVAGIVLFRRHQLNKAFGA